MAVGCLTPLMVLRASFWACWTYLTKQLILELISVVEKVSGTVECSVYLPSRPDQPAYPRSKALSRTLPPKAFFPKATFQVTPDDSYFVLYPSFTTSPPLYFLHYFPLPELPT